MRDFLQRLLSYTCKLGRNSSSKLGAARGFTLIELLVALVVASIMISSLLGFMVDILSKDRKEQAKASTEQEIQAALSYIARDLEQAVYIYDAEGLEKITNKYSTTTGTGQNQLPASANQVPVLVFWKRSILRSEQSLPEDFKKPPKEERVGCLVETTGTKECNNQDYPVYSLVAYYLMKDATCDPNSTWSCAARIGRFEVKDGIRDEEQTENTARDGSRKEGTDNVFYDLRPDPGFNPFILDKAVEEAMNEWTKHSDAYEDTVKVLMDYVDQTTIADGAKPTHQKQEDCQSIFGPKDDNVHLVPNYNSTGNTNLTTTVPDAFKTGSFYACVDSSRTVAQVFIRGNALARTVANSQIANQAKYRDEVSAFFPTGTIQVKGRGLLNVEQN
jgi:prepilin-type N-terminal cleavage/methylation domain-containing protein